MSIELQGSNARYGAMSANFFVKNREKLASKLMPGSIAIIHSNDQMPLNGDGVFSFKQSSDLFYLCGIDQEETILILNPDASEESQRELLFIRNTSQKLTLWEGKKYDRQQAYKRSSISSIYPLDSFYPIVHRLMRFANNIYLNLNEHRLDSMLVKSRDLRFAHWCQENYPLHKYNRLAPLLAEQRMIKDSVEIEEIRKACQITSNAFLKTLPKIKPNMMEYEIEGNLIGEVVKQGSRGFAYNPIIASGQRACILHYEANNQKCEKGDLVLIDVGATYGPYRSDITRTVPVSGYFSDRQKQIYQGVLQILEESKKLLKPGLHTLRSLQNRVGKIVEEVLLDLGLLKLSEVREQSTKNPAYKKYFMHGVSHHLGLNTHDVYIPDTKLQTNMVITLEPGIYILEEKLGIRIEENLVIGENGVENLSQSIPTTVEQIETLMNS